MFNKILITFLLLFCSISVINAQESVIKKDCLPFEDSKGESICKEYRVQYRDAKGRWAKASEVGVKKELVAHCYSSETRKQIKCPKELK